jgi:hypothetical protein
MAEWIDFPIADVIGKKFEVSGIRKPYSGTVTDVTASDSFISFLHDAAGVAEPKRFGCSTDTGSWDFDSKGNVTINIPYAGQFIIYMS